MTVCLILLRVPPRTQSPLAQNDQRAPNPLVMSQCCPIDVCLNPTYGYSLFEIAVSEFHGRDVTPAVRVRLLILCSQSIERF